MAHTLADIDAVLEELYLSNSSIPDQIMRALPALSMLPNDMNTAGGKYRHVHIKTVRPQGRGATFADAQANATGSDWYAFDVTWANNYQVVELDGNVLRDPSGNKTILVNHIEEEMNGAIDTMRDDIGHNLFRNHGGARCQENGTWTSGNDIALADPEDVAHLEVGMVVRVSAADGTSGSLRAGETFITAIDRDAGTFTVDDITDITGFAQGDYIFADGDFGLKMSGFDSWVPSAAPGGGDSFFGVNRSSDAVRLAGVRYDGSSGTVVAAARNLLTRIRRWKKSGGPDFIFVNDLQGAVLEGELEGRKEIVEVEGKGAAAGIGFTGIQATTLNGGGKRVTIIPDPNCQADVMWAINSESWMFEHIGEMVRVLQEDGNRFLRKATSDAYEGRLQCRGNIWCNEPGSNGRASLAAA